MEDRRKHREREVQMESELRGKKKRGSTCVPSALITEGELEEHKQISDAKVSTLGRWLLISKRLC